MPPLNILDNPALEFAQAQLQSQGFDQFRHRLALTNNFQTLSKIANAVIPWNPNEFALYAELLMKWQIDTLVWTCPLQSATIPKGTGQG